MLAKAARRGHRGWVDRTTPAAFRATGRRAWVGPLIATEQGGGLRLERDAGILRGRR